MRKRDPFALRQPLPRTTSVGLGFVAPGLVALLWCLLSYGHFAPPDFLPSPTEVARGTIQLFVQEDLGWAILVSARRIAAAFLLASAVALPIGIMMGAFEPVNRFFEPIVAPLRYMPISAFIPLLILWFGIYEKEKIAFLFLGVFVYLLPVVVTSIRAVPEELVQTALTLGASKGQVVRTVLLPAALTALVLSVVTPNLGWVSALLTGLGTGLVFLAIAALGALLFHAEAMGMGDVKFSVFMGLVLGLRPTLTAVFLGVILAGVAALGLVLLRRRTMRDSIAYGPFLAAGALAALFELGAS